MNLLNKLWLLGRSGRVFSADRKGGPAVEFALVGLFFFLLLFFVIQGGIYFLRETVLDFATETAARAVMINDNPGFSQLAPTSAGAFLNLVASNGFGLLGSANYSTSSIPTTATSSAPMLVSLQMRAEVKPYPSFEGSGPPQYGFQAITPFAFDGSTPKYQLTTVGYCTANYYINYGAQNGFFDGQTGSGVTSISSCSKPAGDSNSSDSACSSSPSTYNGNNQIIGGFADGGTPTQTAPNPGVTQYNYVNGTITCNANQFVLLQVQYTDFTLVPLISSFFGPIVSTVAFKIEPPPT